MADVFLVMLYENSPGISILVVSLCFVITVAVVLSWFGFGVPVILQSSDDGMSHLQIPERRMVQVKNPFALEINSGGSSVSGGVRLNPNCLENCLLSCYWGCTVQGFQKALSDHEQKFRISTPQQFEEAVLSDFQHSTTFFIEKGNITEIVCKLPEGSSIKDFGTLPRARYPLVALLSLAEPEDREIYSIVASVSVIHASDEKYKMTSRILYQYLLTAQGNVFDLKQLFMSADNPISALNSELVSQDDEEKKQEENEAEMAVIATIEEESHGTARRDCIVCQNASINRVLLPCRHTCLCDNCAERFYQCPMCRAHVWESFALSQNERQYRDMSLDDS
ncbi:cell growth regulator with RING finger domain protein 1 [Polypterus senegalus]|uniref:cell growth regulator with RING finger domain protein 1 n=1 Tax=Polypterus senegalus TaxID=55291 RepID=UPI001962B56C|nr:cell growth regulator with RING finger domain protein 1 [Polypterus senegalus]